MEQTLPPETSFNENIFTKLAQTISENDELKTRFTDIVMGTGSQQKNGQETLLPQNSTQRTNSPQEQLTKDFTPNNMHKANDFCSNRSGHNAGQNAGPNTIQGNRLGYKPQNSAEMVKTSAQQVLEFVEKLDPNYFCAAPVREKLRNYLLENCSHLPQRDLFDIIELAKSLETSAVEAFKASGAQKVEHANHLQESNRRTTQRLCADTAKNLRTELNPSQPFTRAQLETMSFDEYLQHKGAIFDQMRKGLIK